MGSDSIRNEGSAARDHLANERTFLAWFRTALGLVGLGVLVERLELHGQLPGKLVGLSMVGFGAICLLYGVRRYLNVAHQLTEGSFPVAKRGPVLLGAVALALTLAVALYLVL